MTTAFNHAHLEQRIRGSRSIRDALVKLKAESPDLHYCDLAYEYMIKDTSYVRGDLVSMTTLSTKFTDLYFPGGGPNSDPVLERLTSSSQPFKISLKKLCQDKQSKFSNNKFYRALFENGCEDFAAYPFKDEAGIGFGVFTIFMSAELRQASKQESYYQELALAVHKSLKAHGQLASYFNLLDREQFVLARMADGKTAADIAQELGITVRTIELRLQSARKKLQARTTTEAVYKAVAYSILPYK